jgi:hypothetical protein
MTRLVLEPQNYRGVRIPDASVSSWDSEETQRSPLLVHRAISRRLYVEVNGGQPTSQDVSIEIFAGRFYEIEVETVTKNP